MQSYPVSQLTKMLRLPLTLCFAVLPAFMPVPMSMAQSGRVTPTEAAYPPQAFFDCGDSEREAGALPTEFDYRVLRKYPHRQQAFTQGLVYHNGHLYESTGRKGHSGIARINLKTGEVLLQRALSPDYFGEGLAVAGEQLVQLSWRAGKVFRYRLDDFTPLPTQSIDGEGWGITHDGQALVTSNGSSTLTWRDEKTMAPLKSLPVTYLGRPLAGINELEWSNGCILANIWPGPTLAGIDVNTGEVVQTLNLQRLLDYEKRNADVDVANGIAIYPGENGRHLLVTGKHWQFIYEILPIQNASQ